MSLQLSFGLESTDADIPLCFELWADSQLIFSNPHVGKFQQIMCNLPNDEGDHILKFILKNKQSYHTIVNEQGEILQDVVLKISNIAFDEIELGHDILNLARYYHDYNGHGKEIEDQFLGEMGCNGTVVLKFSTPIYLWLLENM
jgi:hypothetical protein